MHNCLILGSGRSGTSMIAGILAKAGYYMGDNLIPPREANPKGFFECADINLHSNEEIMRPVTPLMKDGTRWLATLPIDAALSVSPKAAQVIIRMVNKQPYCYKDPRFSYTLHVWRPFLVDTKFICVFRSPESTAQSIVKECQTAKYLHGFPMDIDKALHVWITMHTHILHRHRSQGDWLFVNYAEMLAPKALDKIEAFLDAPVDRSFPVPSLYRSKPNSNIIVPDKAKQLYTQLLELSK